MKRKPIRTKRSSMSQVALRTLLGLGIAIASAQSQCQPVFNVRDYGARGDAGTLDTLALNRAIAACATAGGGQVRVPPGTYLTGTVRLKSNVSLFLESGAEILGSWDLSQYEHFTPPKDCPLIG